MNLIYLIIGLLGGVMAAYLYLHFTTRPKFRAIAEYWVYLPGTDMPDQQEVMTRMVGTNPHTKRGKCPIGPAEGLVMSDIRLSMGHVLKAKNLRLFDPTVILDGIEHTPDIARHIIEAGSMVRLRYISEQPLPDKRHLQFLIHAADTYLELGQGEVVVDKTGRRIWTRPDLSAALDQYFDATIFDLHLKVEIKEEEATIRFVTTGMSKIGERDFGTYPLPVDHRVLGSDIFDQIVQRVWNGEPLESIHRLEAFADQFEVTVEEQKKDRMPLLRLHRRHLQS